MTPALFAPAPTAPRTTTASGTSVLPGVPLPQWALATDVVAPPVEDPDPAPASPAVEQEAGPLDDVAPAVIADTHDEPPQPRGTYSAGLPELGHAAWDAPAPEPHPGSHRFVPGAEPAGAPSSHGRLYVVLGAVAVLAIAAFVAFVVPGLLASSGAEEDTLVTPAVDSAAGAPAPAPANTVEDHYAAWASSTGVTKVSKVSGMPAGTSARCGSATVEGTSGTACAFVAPKVAGTLWYPATGLKAASHQVAATAAAQAR